MRRLTAGALACAALATGCGDARRGGIVNSAGAQRTAENSALTSGRRTAVVEAASRIAPAVVSINVTSVQTVTDRGGWDFFFVPRSVQREVQSSGTGFVVRPDGIIITNQHVVAGAKSITVTLADGTDLTGTLVGEDPTTDIAVVRVPRKDLPVIPLGKSTDLMIGEWVVALGNPYAFQLGNTEPTVTVGVVSAMHRNILPNGEQPGLYLDMIQTDAAINPGNSGGPLANALGEVVGVNSSIFTGGGGSIGSIGLGFAIPIERAVRVADELVRTGSVRRAWTGIEVKGPEGMQDWKSQGGLTVVRTAADGPAAKGGVTQGAVLVEANGRKLRNYLDWEAVKLDLHVGDPVALKVKQGGREEAKTITTGEYPTSTATRVTILRGIELVTVTPAIQGERGLQTAKGALILRINDETSGQTGLQAGDVIRAINRQVIGTAAQVAGILENSRSDEVYRIFFERAGQIVYTDLVFR